MEHQHQVVECQQISGGRSTATSTTTIQVQTLSVLPSRPPLPQSQGNTATRPVTTSTVTGVRPPQSTPAIDPKKRTVAEKTDIGRPDKLKANPIVFRRRT